MSKYSHDLIVIGGGAAGLTLTSGAAQLGLKVAIIEREHMGGDCLYFGCVPSKSLLKSSSIAGNLKRMNKYGLTNVDAPAHTDAKSLTDNIQSVIQSIAYNDSPERFTKLGAEVFLGNPHFTDEHEIVIESGHVKQTISAPRLSIATGSSAFIVPFPGLEETGYLTNRTIFDIKKIPENLLIVGSGPIGVEMGHAFADMGTKVTILTNASQVLSAEDPDIAGYAETALTYRGASVVFNAEIKQFFSRDGLKHAEYTVNNKLITWSGDEILIAIGRQGNTAELGLEKAGIETDRKFIKTNSSLQTSQKHIMAIGDANGKYMFTHVAGAEGSLAVKRQIFGLPGKMSYSNVPWVTYTDPEIASVGYNEKRAKDAGISYRILEAEFKENDRAQAERATEGKIKILFDKNERVIGTQIAGIHAGELLSPAIYAVNGKWKLSQLYNPMLPYPTLTEIYKKAIGGHLGAKLFNPGVRRFLKIFKGYRGNGAE